MTQSPKTLNVTECHMLLDKLQVKNGTPKQFRRSIRNYTMALLMLDAGLRVGEVIKLQRQSLCVFGAIVESLLVSESVAKLGIERTIPLSARLRCAIGEMHKQWWSSGNVGMSVQAFYHLSNDRPLTTRQVERIIRAAAMAAIGRPVHPHVLRHTFASRLMRTCNSRIVQELLGHKHMTSTQIYTHPNQEDLKSAIQKIESDNIPADLQRDIASGSNGVADCTDTPTT